MAFIKHSKKRGSLCLILWIVLITILGKNKNSKKGKANSNNKTSAVAHYMVGHVPCMAAKLVYGKHTLAISTGQGMAVLSEQKGFHLLVIFTFLCCIVQHLRIKAFSRQYKGRMKQRESEQKKKENEKER